MKFNITASIVIFNSDFSMLQRAINSFLNTSLNVRLFIIDNSPHNKIESTFSDPRIEYIYNNKNFGFGIGHNVAIEKILNQSKYHLIMNPDTYYDSQALVSMFNFMEENKDLGLLMPRVLYPDGRNQFLCKLLPTPYIQIVRRFMPIPSFVERVNYTYELRNFDYNSTLDIPFLSGCFMFIRTEVFKKIGMFDENFFMYMEDVDFCRRIKKEYRTVFFPGATVYHEYHKGAYKSLKLLKKFIISSIYYYNKWGWLFDKERKRINSETLNMIKSRQKPELNGGSKKTVPNIPAVID